MGSDRKKKSCAARARPAGAPATAQAHHAQTRTPPGIDFQTTKLQPPETKGLQAQQFINHVSRETYRPLVSVRLPESGSARQRDRRKLATSRQIAVVPAFLQENDPGVQSGRSLAVHAPGNPTDKSNPARISASQPARPKTSQHPQQPGERNDVFFSSHFWSWPRLLSNQGRASHQIRAHQTRGPN